MAVIFLDLCLNKELVVFDEGFLAFLSPSQVRINELGRLLKKGEFLIDLLLDIPIKIVFEDFWRAF